jgi:FtsP/CotA-like multicopper oxidase with cupredoxin domain/peroxiredoxin
MFGWFSTSRGTGCVARAGFLAVPTLLILSGPASGQAPVRNYSPEQARARVLDRAVPYAPPERISQRAAVAAREVTVDLNVEFAEVDVERPGADGKTVKDRLRVRTYNRKLTAPEIRASPGDLLRVRLFNRISRAEPDKPFAPNKPNGFNITNLHTHGLHVSPEGRSDNVYLEVGPEEGIGLCFDIPATHTPGTFWFHAHRHGSTALQLSSGMAGALIVDPGPAGGIDDVPEIKEAMKDGREKVLVFQQLRYTINPQTGLGEVTENDVYDNNPQYRVTLINGVYAPLIEMKRGEVQRWRCVHAGLDSELNLAVVGASGGGQWNLYEIAADGLPLDQMTTQKSILLYPGYRSDFLIQAPDQEGDYVLTNVPVSADRAFRKVTVGRSFRRVPLPADTFARVRVKGNLAKKMDLPQPDAIAKYALPHIDPTTIYNRIPYGLDFYAARATFTINNESFDPMREGVCPRLGTAEEWILTSSADSHPFHIHVNPFEVVQKNAAGTVTGRVWRDTVLIAEGDHTTVRMRFEDYPGKTVLHCHNLIHEDQGMMMAIRLLGKATAVSRCEPKLSAGPAAPVTKALAWSLPDPEGKVHRLADLRGERHLLIFIRGLGCSHCRRQLDALAKYRTALAAAKLKVVAISPESPDTMKQAVREEEAVRSLPFLLLADPSLGAFREYGCFDGRALHGTFVVGAEGTVHWQDVGDDPYMEIEALLARCRQVFPDPFP